MTPIYHITHILNLPTILNMRGLLCDADAERQALCKQGIAYRNIKARRGAKPVRKLNGDIIAAGGVLPDYVPFYFANRSPMLGAINHGTVPGYQGGQRPVIYLVSSVEHVAMTSGLRWCFTDGHAVESVSEFYDALPDLEHIDWDAIKTWKWGGATLADPDVKRRKQAEFLVHQRFPWELVLKIGVFDSEMAQTVAGQLGVINPKPAITIEPTWYYNDPKEPHD